MVNEELPNGFFEKDSRIPAFTMPFNVLPYSSLRAFVALGISSN
jgi:hypothetical protein